MKIAILTSGILPVPAVKGGAVENLIDFYLDYNDRHRLHDITVYSVDDDAVWQHPALIKERQQAQGDNNASPNHYVYINTHDLWAKLRKRLYKLTHGREYYHYTIEFFLEQALKHIGKQHYDLIILENRPGYALKLMKKTDAKIMYHLHNDMLNSETRNAKELYDAASRIITVSNYITNRVRTVNADDYKCVTVYNGIDIQAFSTDKSPAHLTSISDADFVIVFSGRVTQEKGIMELIESMNRLQDYPHIKLLVIGSSFYGNDNNENTFAHMLKTKAEPLKERISFTGFIPYDQMPAYLAQADVAVIPSVWDDPFPTTILEAQAMGLPIITTRRGGIPEEVSDENAIILNTDEHFTDNLAAAILDLYQHPEKRQHMYTASLKRSRLFEKDNYSRNFFKALES